MLARGVRALQEGRPAEAVPLLVAVCDDPEFAAATDLVDIRARASSLCAEALLLVGRPAEAMVRAESALVAARRTGDTDGVDQIERLRERIRAALGSPADGVLPAGDAGVTLTIAEIEARFHDLGARAEWLLRKAATDARDGRGSDALDAANRAIEAAPGSVRIGVLGRLVIARVDPVRAPAELQAALDLARDASEFTLVGAVVRAAELAGIPLDAGRN